ncbi:biotin--[acetyl-CoA-carboxylase] ligase [Pedobacter sp. MC2016-14]|nr:biotin--[acetyl-CoA-carboxylase] ligase [Pedobacter sp. MC2016-14]
MKAMVSNSEPLPEGTVIMAENQFAGRGQQGNAWRVEPGMNLTFSLFLTPGFLTPAQQFLLNMSISLAVCEVLQNLMGAFVKIKWPNDFYYRDKKIGGMLIENTIAGFRYKSAIIGIGLNVNQEHFDVDLARRATSVYQILQQKFDVPELLLNLCGSIEKEYLKLKSANYKCLQSAYLKNLYRYNEKALYLVDGKTVDGQIEDVTLEGLLVLRSAHSVQQYGFKEIAFVNVD